MADRSTHTAVLLQIKSKLKGLVGVNPEEVLVRYVPTHYKKRETLTQALLNYEGGAIRDIEGKFLTRRLTGVFLLYSDHTDREVTIVESKEGTDGHHYVSKCEELNNDKAFNATEAMVIQAAADIPKRSAFQAQLAHEREAERLGITSEQLTADKVRLREVFEGRQEGLHTRRQAFVDFQNKYPEGVFLVNSGNNAVYKVVNWRHAPDYSNPRVICVKFSEYWYYSTIRMSEGHILDVPELSHMTLYKANSFAFHKYERKFVPAVVNGLVGMWNTRATRWNNLAMLSRASAKSKAIQDAYDLALQLDTAREAQWQSTPENGIVSVGESRISLKGNKVADIRYKAGNKELVAKGVKVSLGLSIGDILPEEVLKWTR